MAVEVRTTMYSVGEGGQVVVHKFPFDARDRDGLEKLKKLEKRGFSFNNPFSGEVTKEPEVEVTNHEIDELLKESGQGSEEARSDSEAGIIEVEARLGEGVMIPCPECGERFKSALGVEAHMRKHQRERGELPPVKTGKARKKRKGRSRV